MSLQLRGQIKQTYNMGRFESGDASNPSIAFDASRDTGLFQANGVCVSHEGTRVMQIGGDQVTIDTVLVGNGAGLAGIQASNVVGLTDALDTIDASSVTANVIYGNAGDLVIGANLVPDSNVTYTLGNNTHRFKDLFLSGNTINLGNVELKAQDGKLLCPGFVGDGSLLTGVVNTLSISNVQITSNTYEVLDDTAVGLDGGYCVVNGEGFAGGCLVQVGGTNASATSFVSTTQLRFEAPPKMAGSYNVSVIRGDTTTATLPSALTYSNAVTFTTPSGLGNIFVDESFSIQLNATSDSQITYSNISALPPLTTLSASGQLAGNITSNVVSNSTLYSIDLQAEDEELQDSRRTFLLQLIVLLVSATQYTNSSWQPLTQTALDSNVSGVYWTISGTGFAYISSITVGGTAVTNYTAMSDSQVIVQGPQKVTGTYDVVITTPAGSKTFTNAVTYSDVPVWSTGSTLGNVYQNNQFSFPLVATSDSTITYANTGALPTGISLISGNVTGTITQALTGAASAPYSSSGTIIHDSLYYDNAFSPLALAMSSISGMTYDVGAYELTATVDGRLTVSICLVTNAMPGCDTSLLWAISVDGVYDVLDKVAQKSANINVGSKIKLVVYPEFSPGGRRQIYNASTLSYTITAEQVYSIGVAATDQELQSTERTFTLTYIGYQYLGQISSPQVIGGEVFSASSVLASVYDASKAFDGDYGSFWHDDASTTYINGVYQNRFSTTVSGTTRYGEWLQIQFAQPVYVKRFTISPRTGWTYRMPTEFVLAGSNDGSTWTQLLYFNNSGQTYTASTDTNFNVNATVTYTHYRLIFMRLVTDGNSDSVQISQWKIFDS